MTATWLAREGAPLIVGFGGGLNSTALLVLLHERGIKPDLITFADTGGRGTAMGLGNEKPETYRHVQEMQEWLAARGWPAIHVVSNDSPRANYISLEHNCVAKEMLPSRAYGMSSCAEKWKIRPQNKYVRAWLKVLGMEHIKPFKLLGYDGGEERRAKIYEDDVCRYAYPLIEWDVDRAGCVEAVKRAGLGHVPKSACFFCPSMTKPEVIRLSEEHPDLFDRAVAMERIALASGELQNVKGLGRHWSWENLVQLHRAGEAAKVACMIESPVESCTMCADQSDE